MQTSLARSISAEETATIDQEVITHDCFNAVLRLRNIQSDEAEETYQSLRRSLDLLLESPQSLGLAPEEAQDIAYAVIALADEVALKTSTEMARFWLPRMLQLHYFNENMAGEGFFERLDKLRNQPERPFAQQAFYHALALGFQGRYGVEGETQQLNSLMATLRQSLISSVAARFHCLSPHGDDTPDVVVHKRAWPRIPWIPVALFVICLVGYGLMSFVLSHAMHNLQKNVASARDVGPRG